MKHFSFWLLMAAAQLIAAGLHALTGGTPGITLLAAGICIAIAGIRGKP